MNGGTTEAYKMTEVVNKLTVELLLNTCCTTEPIEDVEETKSTGSKRNWTNSQMIDLKMYIERTGEGCILQHP